MVSTYDLAQPQTQTSCFCFRYNKPRKAFTRLFSRADIWSILILLVVHKDNTTDTIDWGLSTCARRSPKYLTSFSASFIHQIHTKNKWLQNHCFKVTIPKYSASFILFHSCQNIKTGPASSPSLAKLRDLGQALFAPLQTSVFSSPKEWQ